MIATVDDVFNIISEIKGKEPHKEIKVKWKRTTQKENEMELRAKVESGEIKLGPKLSDILSGEVKLSEKENVIINLILKGDNLSKFFCFMN